MTTSIENVMCRVRPSFLDVLRTVGANGEVFRLGQVFHYLKVYIHSRALYDIKDPSKIYCENDALGRVFGVKMFTLDDVLKLVLSNIQYEVNVLPKVAEAATVHNGSCPIEKPKPADDLNHESPSTRPRSPMFLELGTSPVYDSSPETVVSLQGYETECAKDESDDLWYLDGELDTDDLDSDISVEFEVMSVTSSCRAEFSDTDDSYIAEFADGDILIGRNDSDMEFWADKSDCEDQTSDPDLCDADNWKCKHCNVLNRPLLRYCQKCWQLRQGWLPAKRKRAQKSRRKRQRATLSFMGQKSVATLSALRRSASVEVGALDVRDTADVEAVTEDVKTVQASAEGPLEVEGQTPSGSANVNRVPLRRSVSDSLGMGSCTVCLTRPKDATLVHGRTAHQICCYPCGKKLWETDQPCPICRRPIAKVVRNFIV